MPDSGKAGIMLDMMHGGGSHRIDTSLRDLERHA